MDAEHKPVTIAEVIAGGQTISTHCLACGHRGELDPPGAGRPRGRDHDHGRHRAPAPLRQVRRTIPAGRAADAAADDVLQGVETLLDWKATKGVPLPM